MYCPDCGADSLSARSNKEYRCDHCGFHFFHNVATGVMVAICWQDEVLVARRAREPGKGRLDLPGGFVDPGESMEMALRREVAEELGLELDVNLPLHYLGSFANIYPYDGVTYHTCDTLFCIELAEKPSLVAGDDVSACEWMRLQDLPLARFAFPSTRQGLERLQQRMLCV